MRQSYLDGETSRGISHLKTILETRSTTKRLKDFEWQSLAISMGSDMAENKQELTDAKSLHEHACRLSFWHSALGKHLETEGVLEKSIEGFPENTKVQNTE